MVGRRGQTAVTVWLLPRPEMSGMRRAFLFLSSWSMIRKRRKRQRQLPFVPDCVGQAMVLR